MPKSRLNSMFKYVFIALLFMGVSTPGYANSGAIKCSKIFKSKHALVVDLTIDAFDKELIRKESEVETQNTLKKEKDKPSFISKKLGRLYYNLSNYLLQRNTNSYFFYYVNSGVPQKARYMVKVGLDFKETPDYLAEIGITLDKKDISERSLKLASRSNGTKSEDLVQSEKNFKDFINHIWRYESIKEDIFQLEANARLRHNMIISFEELLSMDKIEFPIEAKVTEKVSRDGEISESHYTFNSRAEIHDQINTLKGLEREKFGKGFTKKQFLNGRYEEQAELRGLLYIYKAELQRYPYSFGYPRLRQALLEKLNKVYNDESLVPPHKYNARQYMHEMHWEVHRYLGHRIDSDQGKKSTNVLWRNDISELGLFDHKLSVFQISRRVLFLSLPVQAFVYTCGFGVPYVKGEIENYLYHTHRAEAAQTLAVDFNSRALDYFSNEHGFDITLPKNQWPLEIKNEFAALVVEHQRFLRELNENDIDLKEFTASQIKLRELNASLYKYAPALLDGIKIDSKHLSPEDSILVKSLEFRINTLRLSEKSEEEIEHQIFKEFINFDD